ncbi:phosphatidylinositolN-acetyglucosaminlytransferase subunit P-related [Striga asiatica]|uniref:PhosphatidylinositolN-acetyglucosaminlytransferase subunit P-related n=1 Tax=Striga asiatica TaxID=4170 RepID=A0A5A7P7J0_STRAF|nr:phosphatidylinositolN-acetyglucosaminlytransferase subunit P-related [Striga asiatica]
MERARHRKSKSASGIEGIQQIQKAKAAPRLSTDSRTYIDGTKRDDLFMLELGQSSWRGPTGTPMKKLLAEEMSREVVEPRRRPPGVIARLMGFDGLPSPKHIHQSKEKRLSDIYQPKSRSLRYHDNRTTRSPPEFKDVYEDLEAASASHHRCSSRWRQPNELSLIQQKLLDSPGNRIAVLKPYESKAKPAAVSGPRVTLRRVDGLLLEQHCHGRRACISHEEKTTLPTRIVVLKPDLGKVENLSSSLSHRRKDFSSEVGLSRSISKEAREIAREITMRIRDGYDESNDLRSVWGKGYVGDESSYECDESDSESEPEGFGFSCRNRLSVNREAKKRLSERWKMTHKCREMDMINSNSKGGTLAEVLTRPDRETRHSRVNVKTSHSAISSTDGWTDEITRNSLRSKSLPPGSSRGRRSRKTNLAEAKVVMHGENVNWERSKFVKRNVGYKEGYLSRYSKVRGKKPHPCDQDMFNGEIDSSSAEASFEIQMEANIKDISEQQSAFEMSAKAEACRSPVVDVMMISESASTTLSNKPSKLVQKQLSSGTGGNESAVQEWGDCVPQELNKVPSKQASSSTPCPGAEPEPSESSKEANHPSPNSVLEVPFTEDASSADNFERVNAELQELRLQLQLLKMESSTDADMSTLHPIEEEEDKTQNSPVFPEGNYATGPEGWEIHYALDVLVTSELLQDPDYFTMFNNNTSWYSQEEDYHPLDPKLFDTLEKKYSDEYDEGAIGAKWERKLLFDRINSALMQIFVEHVDPCPWVMPKSTGSNLVMKWRAHGVREAAEKLIEKLELTEVEAVDREMGWAGPRGEVEMVGNEIEKLLMDDMVAEVILYSENLHCKKTYD